jgi:hypothetical protein
VISGHLLAGLQEAHYLVANSASCRPIIIVEMTDYLAACGFAGQIPFGSDRLLFREVHVNRIGNQLLDQPLYRVSAIVDHHEFFVGPVL